MNGAERMTPARSLVMLAGAAAAQDRTIRMSDYPGSLEPATNASFVGRVSLRSVCDKLFDIDTDGNLVPMLAEDWTWSEDNTEVTFNPCQGVTFDDGTPFYAEGVAYNINKFQTLDGSRRRAELSGIEELEVVDDCTILRSADGKMEGGADPRRPAAVAGW